jgi:malonate transporter and related proteins
MVAILGLAFVLAGVPIVEPIARSLAVLGAATAGASLFASGIVLFAYEITVTSAIGLMVVAKNLVIPIVTLLVLALIGAPRQDIRESILTLAIPTASYAVIIALQYRSNVRDVSSMFFWSTITSFATMALFIAVT